MNEVELSVLGEIYLAKILGSTMLHVHGKRDEGRWKKLLKRISISIEKAVLMNVQTDGFHKAQLDKYISNIKKACEESEVFDPSIILSLVAIIFELLGGTPDYTDRRRLNRKDDYRLNGQRRLCYLQSQHQRVRTILRASREKPYDGFHKYDDLFNQFALHFRSNAEEFMRWYKKTYPKLYMMLF